MLESCNQRHHASFFYNIGTQIARRHVVEVVQWKQAESLSTFRSLTKLSHRPWTDCGDAFNQQQHALSSRNDGRHIH
jgi:hypothetical protein